MRLTYILLTAAACLGPIAFGSLVDGAIANEIPPVQELLNGRAGINAQGVGFGETHASTARSAAIAGAQLDNYLSLFITSFRTSTGTALDRTKFASLPATDKRCGPPPLDPKAIETLIRSTAFRYGVDDDFALAIAWTESRYDQVRNSSRGARGPMQLMPDTAARFGVTDICDPVQNIDAGVHYLRVLLDRFGNQVFAAAAYNAGEQAIYEHDGVPAYTETIRYVASVINRQLGPANPAKQSRIDDHQVGETAAKPSVQGVIGAPSASFVNGVMQFSVERKAL